MDRAIEKALLTWYPVDHPLHNDPRHPAIKLAGEAGELLDLYGKHEYKPKFSWWDCKHCKKTGKQHSYTINDRQICSPILSTNTIYTPLVLDELGDLWYYLRILAYQYNYKLTLPSTLTGDILLILSSMNMCTARILSEFENDGIMNFTNFQIVFNWLCSLLNELDTTLDELTELNYLKLNSEPTNHGWHNAGIK